MTAKEFFSFVGGKTIFWLTVGMIAGVIAAIVEYLNAIFIQVFLAHLDLIDASKLPSYVSELSKKTTLTIVSIYVAIVFVRTLAVFWGTYAPYVFQELMINRLKLLTAFEILLTKPQRWLPASQIFLRYGELFPKAGNFMFQVSLSLVLGLQLIFLFGGMVYLCWKETIIGLVGIASIGLIIRYSGKKILQISSIVPYLQIKTGHIIERISRNWVLVRISGTQLREFGNLSYHIVQYFRHTIRGSFYIVFNGNHPNFFGVVLISIIILVSRSVFHTEGATLVMFFYLFIRFVQNISGFVSTFSQALVVYPQFQQSFLAYKEMGEEVTQHTSRFENSLRVFKRSDIDVPKISDEKRNFDRLPPAIEIQNLDFAWADNQVFKKFNLNVPAGSVIGIKGESGSGKSTLLQLILGIQKPQHGSILINGILPETYIDQYSESIGYVGADPFLFEGTLRDNISYGLRYHPSDDEIKLALEKAQMLTYVESIKEGLEYKLNENGEGLSSGQKQRVSLARAFLRQPALLILDEATANLDMKTEEEIEKSIQYFKGKCTIIIVSHREGILKSVDSRLQLPIQN